MFEQALLKSTTDFKGKIKTMASPDRNSPYKPLISEEKQKDMLVKLAAQADWFSKALPGLLEKACVGQKEIQNPYQQQERQLAKTETSVKTMRLSIDYKLFLFKFDV